MAIFGTVRYVHLPEIWILKATNNLALVTLGNAESKGHEVCWRRYTTQSSHGLMAIVLVQKWHSWHHVIIVHRLPWQHDNTVYSEA